MSDATTEVLREAVREAMAVIRDATPDIVEPELFALGGPTSPREEADHILYHQVLLPASNLAGGCE